MFVNRLSYYIIYQVEILHSGIQGPPQSDPTLTVQSLLSVHTCIHTHTYLSGSSAHFIQHVLPAYSPVHTCTMFISIHLPLLILASLHVLVCLTLIYSTIYSMPTTLQVNN